MSWVWSYWSKIACVILRRTSSFVLKFYPNHLEVATTHIDDSFGTRRNRLEVGRGPTNEQKVKNPVLPLLCLSLISCVLGNLLNLLGVSGLPRVKSGGSDYLDSTGLKKYSFFPHITHYLLL